MISFNEFKIFRTGTDFSLDIFIAIPNMIDITRSAIILSVDNNSEKLFTDIKLTVLSKIETSSESVVSKSSASVDLISSLSCESTSSNVNVVAKPINTAINEVSKNTTIIAIIILPSLLGVCIFAIDVVIVTNISGTIITNNIFKNKSPNGLRIVAFSPKQRPTIVPTIIETKIIIVDL